MLQYRLTKMIICKRRERASRAGNEQIIKNPVIPMSSPLIDGFPDDAAVEIIAELFNGANGGFTVEFLSLNGVPFHMSLRTDGVGCWLHVNNQKGTRWDREKRHPLPVQPGQPFSLAVENGRRYYQIYVNDSLICEYRHSENPKKVNGMTIRGDVRVAEMRLLNFKHYNIGGNSIGTGVGMVASPQVMMSSQPAVLAAPPQMGPPPGYYTAVQPQPQVQPQPAYEIVNGGRRRRCFFR